MITTFKSIAGSQNEKRVASQLKASGRSASVFGHPLRRFIAPAFALCSLVLATAPANAGGLQAASKPGAAGIDSGWWEAATAIPSTPQLQLSMAEVTHFATSEVLRNAPAQPASNVSGPASESSASPDNFGARPDAGVARQALFANEFSQSQKSAPSLLEAEFQGWYPAMPRVTVSHPSDSHPLTEVNGSSVSPLWQINYAQWHLPITLYVSPLRGSDPK